MESSFRSPHNNFVDSGGFGRSCPKRSFLFCHINGTSACGTLKNQRGQATLEAQKQPGSYRFREVDQDEKRMRRIFEKFVRNFFARRQRTFNVKQDHSDWFATALEGSNLQFLPHMITDATLRSADRAIVIECKYTESLCHSRFFADKLRSAHLYQLCAYLRNLAQGGSEPDRHIEGILLYPTAGIALDQSYLLHGHRVRIKTLDLNQPWTSIEDEMLGLLQLAP